MATGPRLLSTISRASEQNGGASNCRDERHTYTAVPSALPRRVARLRPRASNPRCTFSPLVRNTACTPTESPASRQEAADKIALREVGCCMSSRRELLFASPWHSQAMIYRDSSEPPKATIQPFTWQIHYVLYRTQEPEPVKCPQPKKGESYGDTSPTPATR